MDLAKGLIKKGKKELKVIDIDNTSIFTFFITIFTALRLKKHRKLTLCA